MPGPAGVAPSVPRATIRLQLHKDFTFDDATETIPYLAALGVSHIYASPFLAARAGSMHGYDIIDHSRFNPEIGDEAAFDRMVATLHQHGMGLILDFVPNHMGVGGADNPWWLDVLEWGQASPFAAFFDIDWSPADPSLRGKVLLPFLGDHYGNVLEAGDLALRFDTDRGAFSVWYYEHRFPIAVRHYPRILQAAQSALGDRGNDLAELIAGFTRIGRGRRSVRRQTVLRGEADALKSQLAALAAERREVGTAIEDAVAALNGRPGEPRSFRPLHDLLERQAYRVAFWRVAAHEINYRRFFDINDLAGLRIEREDLFELSHQLVFRLIGEGKLQGLRLDHIDGLYEPAAYCRRLQDRAAYLLLQAQASGEGTVAIDGPQGRSNPLYLVVEKILARHERLRESWPVDGTTGYDFMNLVNGLFVDPAGEGALTEIYHRFVGESVDFEMAVVAAKRQLVRTNLSSELNVIASELHDIARQSWRTRDYTATAIREALLELVAHFPVYRTYIAGTEVGEEDRRFLDWAMAQARKAALIGDTSVYDFIHSVLSTDLVKAGGGYRRREIVAVAMKFQQITGPVMAKAVEDTAFYRYHRLVSLNEVGGEPGRFGVGVAAFHHLNQERLRQFPLAMITTASHDHKRGEDTRARIDVLSEMTEAWERAVQLWARANRSKIREVDGQPAPDRNDEYLFYQTVVGTWPHGVREPDDDYRERLVGYMIKAIREAKRRSSWAFPNADYEAAVEAFVRESLDAASNAWFVGDVVGFQERAAVAGALNGLSQVLLKLTAPGVPDTYQGTEYWDLSLVDPDNRRAVDFAARQRTLAASAAPDELVAGWSDGRIKQHVIARALDLRRRFPALFCEGDYQPLEVVGPESERLVAFARRHEGAAAITVAPRLLAPLLGDSDRLHVPPAAWADTALRLPDELPGRAFRDEMTGRVHETSETEPLAVATLLSAFPLALLVSVES